MTLILACLTIAGIQAQEIVKEVQNIEQQQLAIKNDTKKPLNVRLVATFKADALYYLVLKASQTEGFTEQQLGEQASAMIDFVNLYVKRLTDCKKKADKDMLLAKFRAASVNHALFNDMDKDVVYAYVDNDKYITQFSIDTDWKQALLEVKTR